MTRNEIIDFLESRTKYKREDLQLMDNYELKDLLADYNQFYR